MYKKLIHTRPSSVSIPPLICQGYAPHLSSLRPSSVMPDAPQMSVPLTGLSPETVGKSGASRRFTVLDSLEQLRIALTPLKCQYRAGLRAPHMSITAPHLSKNGDFERSCPQPGQRENVCRRRAYAQVSLSPGSEGQGASVPAGRVAPSLGLGVKRQRARGIAGA